MTHGRDLTTMSIDAHRLARIIRSGMSLIDTLDSGAMGGTKKSVARLQYQLVAEDMAMELRAKYGDRFDRAAFLAACGVGTE